MWLFKRRKQKENNSKPALSDKVAEKIAGAGIKVQTKFSEFMNKLFLKLSPGKLKLLLVVFCLSVGGYSIYLIANALFGDTAHSLKIEQVTVPVHINKTGDEVFQYDQTIDEATYREIYAFKYFMDSLKQNRRHLYDSIMLARPGLMDSIIMLESLYNEGTLNGKQDLR